MLFTRFHIQLVVRVTTLTATIFACAWTVAGGLTPVAAILGLIAVCQLYLLVRFLSKVHRDLSRFLQSILLEDFSQSFSLMDPISSKDDLKTKFNQVRQHFMKLREEKEENLQYLQTVVRHIGVGVITYKKDGTVVLINEAAKRLFNVSQLKSVAFLDKYNRNLASTLLQIAPGEDSLIKIDTVSPQAVLSVRATEFRMHGESYRLVSIQDIASELARERMARELEIAWQVQGSLLPRETPLIQGFDISGRCLPATEVSGDYFDFIPMENGKLAVIIADVSGKGVPAAFYMTLTKGYVQSVVGGDIPARQILDRINEQLHRTLGAGTFVTMMVAIVNPANRRVTCSRAGHNPALHYSPAGDFGWVQPEGMVLGITGSPAFGQMLEETEVSMQPGDWLVFFTDGVSDAVNTEDQEYSIQRLMETIRENAGKSAREMAETILVEVQTFVGSRGARDDMTLVALKAL
ncbi:MAG: PP2C family protein-serine/threonine phosphatase [Acidobacteriota bacterium]